MRITLRRRTFDASPTRRILMETAREHTATTAGRTVERFETIVVGGGQAGLSAGYYLQQRGRPFVILDANERIGGSWRTRTWNSLRLFTPARFDGLPGWRFPGHPWSFPTARELADYLEAYAVRFDLPVRTRTTVRRLTRRDGRYVLDCGDRLLESEQVIVATGFYGKPFVPGFASELDPRIVQMHSSEYREPSQLQPGDVLLVGAGNSGADIAMELAPSHRTLLSGRDKGQVPIRVDGWSRRLVTPALWFIASRLLTVRTPIGRKVRLHVLASGAPRIRVKLTDLDGAGVERVPKTVGVSDGLPVVEGRGPVDVANVVWCTGFRPDFGWIDLPVLGDDGNPTHDRGVAPVDGLYFIGLDFLSAFTSENVGGVGRDARRLVRHIESAL
jgi:putative flavoprotein involved in K+ transport